MPTFEEIMARVALPVATVSLCLAGDVLDEIATLKRQLADAPPASNLGERSPAAAIRERLEAATARMRESEADFKLRAIPGPEWNPFWVSSPNQEEAESDTDYQTRFVPWICEMVARCCVEPQMTTEQVGLLSLELPATSWNQLVNACFRLNRTEVAVPNFEPASDEIPSSNGTSGRLLPTESPTAATSAASPAKQRRTSTTTRADSSAA